MIGGAVAASLAAAAAAVFLLAAPEPKAETANLSNGLLAQMQYAVSGGGPATHIYGGRLRSKRRYGNIAVVAAGVPKSACVEVGA